jgi:ferric-dicitrate binding protein FerR (iron transport regulator)
MKDNYSEKIDRYINGRADNDEEAFVESLFLNGENDPILRYSLERDWNNLDIDSYKSEVNIDHLLDRVHHDIHKTGQSKKRSLFYRLGYSYMRVAAILLLPLLITGGLAYNYFGKKNNYTEEQQVTSSIYAPYGSRVNFTLPDGTIGMLNSGSILTYSLPFNKSRKVSINGEAWFNVSHDEAHPFEISSGTSKIKVLGTKFNISAYPEENYIEVVLQEGKVSYSNHEVPGEFSMTPSERLVFQDGTISRSVTDPAKYCAWTKGNLVFRGDPMVEVARRIERWYNIKIELKDKELENYSFRATFQDDKLEEVLKFLSMTSPMRYEIKDRTILSDGTVEKEKVTIYLKR